ncbi:MAG: hypothetical protein WBN41_10570 [Lysobacterales bacterium]
MFKLRMFFAFSLILFTCNAVAEDVYISGGDSAALQAAIDAAIPPGAEVTIHLEAGQVFQGTPRLHSIAGHLTIQGNGAVFRNGAGLGSVSSGGVGV